MTELLREPSSVTLGVAAGSGRQRIVYAIPMGPREVQPPTVVMDRAGLYLADPQGNLIGSPAVWVHRMLMAGRTEDSATLLG